MNAFHDLLMDHFFLFSMWCFVRGKRTMLYKKGAKPLYDSLMEHGPIMSKPAARTFSRHSEEAARLLGLMIRTARTERGMTIEQLAERAGVSRGLVTRAEAGDMRCAIGTVFELATLVGVSLFTADSSELTRHVANSEKTLSLLPRAVRHRNKEVNDDF